DARHVHPDALDRDGGHAAARRRLRGHVRELEPLHLLLRLPAWGRPADLPLQHDRQLALRAEGGTEPVAGEDDRVAGLLASAGLQLRRDPARRRRAVRVRRAWRAPRDHARRGGRGETAREGRGGGAVVTDETTTTTTEESTTHQITDVGTPQEHASEVVAKREVATFGDPDPPPSREGVKRVLCFLNEVAGGRKLLTACRELAGAGADYFAVVAPQNLPAVGQLVDVEERRQA